MVDCKVLRMRADCVLDIGLGRFEKLLRSHL